MTIVGWTLYVCLVNGHGLHCREATVAQMSYISNKPACEQAVKIIEDATDWRAYCLPVTREN